MSVCYLCVYCCKSAPKEDNLSIKDETAKFIFPPGCTLIRGSTVPFTHATKIKCLRIEG